MVADYHQNLARRLPLPPVDSVVLPGIPAASIADGPGPHVADAAPEVIFTGRLDATPQKRAEWLIAWWPQVLAAVPGARLTLIGGGSALPALRQAVARAGLAASVSLPGPLPHPQLLDRLRQAGLYVFPSQLETFGIAPLEALAAGLPVVASDLPALRESLGDAALLLPVEDEAAWVATLIRLLRDPAERLYWAAQGPPRARQLTWDRQAAAFEAELQAALATAVAHNK
jgi:glycosyltransferase involved in cell wall biosynthesis